MITTERVHGLEGARGLAAFWVYTHHFMLIFYPAFYFGEHTWLNSILNADLAVSWFFVHSGFVLTYKASKLEGDQFWHNLKDHALRRYIRLVPIVLVSILVTYVFLKMGWTFNHEYGKTVNSQWLGRYFHFEPDILEALKQSFYGVYFDFKSHTTYDPNLWTIGAEMICSYLLFVAVAVFGWWKWAALPFIALALAVGTWKGFMCFLLGAALTRIPKHKTRPATLIFLTLIAFSLTDLKGPMAGYIRGLAAFVLMYCLLQAPRVRDILATRPIHRLGELSYSFYSIHFLLLTSLTSYLGIIWEGHLSLPKTITIYLISTIVLFAVSYLMWIWVDAPGIKLGKKFSSLLVRKPTSGSGTQDMKVI